MTEKIVIQGLWVGERLPTMQQISIASFLAHGHDFHLYTYGAVRDVPAGAIVKEAAEIIPQSMVFKNASRNTFAAFSDFFRYKLLLDKGGWWADVDTVCLRPFAFEEDYVFSSELDLCRERTNTGVIKAPKGSELMSYTWEACNRKDRDNLAWDEVGPALLEEAVARFSLEAFVKPAITFCPLPAPYWRAVMEPDRVLRFEPATYAIHLWHEMWRFFSCSVDADYAPGCLYEQFKTLYLRGSPIGR